MVDPQPPLHWGYSGSTWVTAPGAVPPSQRMKRHLSESDDCDDVFSEESSKDQCSSPGDDCQLMSRKKRRGVIEKRRRDRINTSLIELKRLVPTAFEKQGSAKLEKAEILQMTVDHLKMLHANGMDALAYDPHKFAMDYHNIGFRECASEVARYLVTVEGMDIQEPLRLRLMSHLQCFASQRASVPSAAPWYAASQPYTPNNPQAFAATPPQAQANGAQANGAQADGAQADGAQHKYDNYEVNSSTGYSHSQNKVHTLTPLTTSLGYSGHQYMNLSSTGIGHTNQNFNSSSASNMKPYRPWGAEVAY